MDHFNKVCILPDMQPVLAGTLEGDAWSVHLGETITIIHFYGVKVLKPPPDLLRIRFGPDKGDPERKIVLRIDLHFFYDIHEKEQKTGDDMDDFDC